MLVHNRTDSSSPVGDLFDSTPQQSASAVSAVLRTLDIGSTAGEIKLRVTDLNENVRRLEKAQIVSQELLDAVVSL